MQETDHIHACADIPESHEQPKLATMNTQTTTQGRPLERPRLPPTTTSILRSVLLSAHWPNTHRHTHIQDMQEP